MSVKIDELLPTAKEIQKQTALKEAEKADQYARRLAAAEAEKRAENLLARVELSQRLRHRPGELSGGEQQRVALARALVMQPRLLLADEPTGNLDRNTGKKIHDLLLALNNELGMTLLVVTHNDGLAEKLPRQLRMVDGTLQEGAR